MRLLFLCGLLALASAQSLTSLRFETRDNAVHVIVPRVGSGPGETNIDFVLDLTSSDILLQGDPARYSKTAQETDQNDIYSDTFYWPQTFTVQHFTANTDRNVLGLGKDSDLWQQFAWLEICPKHGLIFLHKEGAHTDRHLHQCGEGTGILHQTTCENAQECTLLDEETLLEYFGISQQQDFEVPASVLLPGAEGTTFLEYNDNLSLPNRTSAEALGVYAAFFPEANSMTLLREYEAKHTHSTIGFLVLETLLLFYLHFVSDMKKDFDNCKWTRYPAFVGNSIAVVCMGLIFYHYNLQSRLFHATEFFRMDGRDAIMADLCFYLVVVLSIIVHALITIEKKTLPLRRLHMEVLYDLVLQFPLTLSLMGGGKFNLMNLLFVFVVTLVVIGSRVRDIISVIRSFVSKSPENKVQHKPIDFLLYTVEVFSFGVYMFLVWLTVWIPAFSNLFVLATIPNYAAGCTLAVFCAAVARIVADHNLYTVMGAKASRKVL